MRRHFHLFLRHQLAVPVQRGDVVRLEQLADAAGQLAHDLVLARDHGRHVRAHALVHDAVQRVVISQGLEQLGALQQRLGRDAADVEAGAAQGGLALLAHPLVDAGSLQTQLGAADRCDVPGRAGADDDDVEFVGHSRIPSYCCGARPDRAGAPRSTECAAPLPAAAPCVLSYTSSRIRCGSSTNSLIVRRKVTAPLPSTMRWS